MKIELTRAIELPDPVRLELYRRSPDLGPRVLFFSGGSALRKACYELIRYSHNSIHLITPFDSGGSSAVLRDAFRMPAIGDLRNRLLALADRSLHGNPAVFRLFAHRFPKEADPEVLADELEDMIQGRHPLVADIPNPMRQIIRRHIQLFRRYMPKDFDLRKASIGNLILTAGYLDTENHLDPVIFIFSKLVQVRGTVRPVISGDLHLVAETEDGRTIVGQHRITGKEVSPLTSPIQKLYISAHRQDPRPIRIPIPNKIRKLISQADLICYPIGSFYSSVVANLLPQGVSSSIRNNPCPKVFVPNTVPDPECYGMSLQDQVETLLRYLKADDPAMATEKVLNFVLLNDDPSVYPGELEAQRLERMGIRLLRCPLTRYEGAPYIDEKQMIPMLLSLA